MLQALTQGSQPIPIPNPEVKSYLEGTQAQVEYDYYKGWAGEGQAGPPGG
jgi:hypothetical protein